MKILKAYDGSVAIRIWRFLILIPGKEVVRKFTVLWVPYLAVRP